MVFEDKVNSTFVTVAKITNIKKEATYDELELLYLDNKNKKNKVTGYNRFPKPYKVNQIYLIKFKMLKGHYTIDKIFPKNSYIDYQGQRAIFGEIVSTTNSNYRIVTKAFKDKYHEINSNDTLSIGDTIFTTVKEQRNRLTKNGAPIQVYNLNTHCIIKRETIINIGHFSASPTPVSQIYSKDMSPEQKKKILLWMAYVADEWEPHNNPELLKQKEAIKKQLALINKEKDLI